MRFYPQTPVLGSQPVVDAATGMRYVGTGNNYTVPAAAVACTMLPGPSQPVARQFPNCSTLTCPVTERPVGFHNFATAYDRL